jgi:hypothetical protein
MLRISNAKELHARTLARVARRCELETPTPTQTNKPDTPRGMAKVSRRIPESIPKDTAQIPCDHWAKSNAGIIGFVC